MFEKVNIHIVEKKSDRKQKLVFGTFFASLTWVKDIDVYIIFYTFECIDSKYDLKWNYNFHKKCLYTRSFENTLNILGNKI